jgi:hypothetical protein
VSRERRRVVADALVAFGGLLLIGSAFAHWVSRGAGSRLRGHALFDVIIATSRHLPGLSAARITVLWYLVPATGAMSWIALGIWGAASRASRVVAVVAAVAAVGSAAAIGALVGYGKLGIGAWLAVGGAALLVVGAWAVATRRAPDPSVRMAGPGR